MRFARLASPVINDPKTYKFELGKGIVMREGADVTIIAVSYTHLSPAISIPLSSPTRTLKPWLPMSWPMLRSATT